MIFLLCFTVYAARIKLSSWLTLWHSFKRKVVGMTQCKQLQAQTDSYLSMIMLYGGKKNSHWEWYSLGKWPREAVVSPSLGIFSTWLDKALSNLISCWSDLRLEQEGWTKGVQRSLLYLDHSVRDINSPQSPSLLCWDVVVSCLT